MKLDILLNKQTFLWKEENKLQKRRENLPAMRTNVVVFTKNRKFKFLQDGNAELWRDLAAASCQSRRFVSSLITVLLSSSTFAVNLSSFELILPVSMDP